LDRGIMSREIFFQFCSYFTQSQPLERGI
jgi:hypothetical protein